MSNEQIADGWYDAKAKNWRWKQASTGTWQLEIWFELSEHGQVVGEMPGWFAVTDKTIDKRVEQFTALGYQPVSCDIGQEIGCDESGACYGGLDINTVRAVVKTEADRNGVERTKVDNIVAPKPRAAQTVDAGALKAFGAQMRGAVMAAAQRAKAAGGAAAPQAAQRPTPQARPAPVARPAPQPTRGPQTARPVAEEAPDFSGGDECPF